MSDPEARTPHLLKLYHRYLDTEDSAAFIKSVSQYYTTASLSRLAEYGDYLSRRAGILALGYLAGYEANAVIGRAMKDADRGVRMLAENGIRQLWHRAGSETQRQKLATIVRLNNSQQFAQAIHRATELIEESPWIAEAWNQRAIAYYQLMCFEDSANDCHQTLEINPYHFSAAVGMGHCYLELTDATAALECFRRALRLNPDMEGVRTQVDYLERSLEEK